MHEVMLSQVPLFFFNFKGFIALTRAGHTCRFTKLFLNTTNSQQYLTITIDDFNTAKLQQWKLLYHKQETLQPLGIITIGDV
jgi:hypothetical protein